MDMMVVTVVLRVVFLKPTLTFPVIHTMVAKEADTDGAAAALQEALKALAFSIMALHGKQNKTKQSSCQGKKEQHKLQL